MFAVGRKGEADEIALARGVVIAQAIVGKVAQLIIGEVENGDGLARAGFLGAVSLVEQRGVTSVWTERDGSGKAVGAGEVSRDWKGQSLTGGKIDVALTFGGASNHEKNEKRSKRDKADNGKRFRRLTQGRFHGRNPWEGLYHRRAGSGKLAYRKQDGICGGGGFSKTTTLSWDNACGCASTTARDSSPQQPRSARHLFPRRDSCDIDEDNCQLAGPSRSRWARKGERERDSLVRHAREVAPQSRARPRLPENTELRFPTDRAPATSKGCRGLARDKLR